MHTKLTLRIDDDLIKRTKRIARDRNLSLSEIVAQYFRSLSSRPRAEGPESAILDEITGIMKGGKRGRNVLAGYKKHLEGKYR